MSLVIKVVKPLPELHCFVDSFWMLHNPTDEAKEAVVLPDGRIDLMLSIAVNRTFQITVRGLDTSHDQVTIDPQTKIFAISLNPLAAEYLLARSVASLLDTGEQLPDRFWGFEESDLEDFDQFCATASRKLESMCGNQQTDNRKQQLFDLVFAANGNTTVKELSDKVHWSSRQINRYFNQQYGLSLKAYCNIIRFRSSFQNLKQGKLFPEENFADQSHFIKQIKQLSGVSPKKLAKNQNDRFVQFSALPPK